MSCGIIKDQLSVQHAKYNRFKIMCVGLGMAKSKINEPILFTKSMVTEYHISSIRRLFLLKTEYFLEAMASSICLEITNPVLKLPKKSRLQARATKSSISL